MSILIKLFKDTCGLTSLDYAFIAVWIGAGLVFGLGVLGDSLATTYGEMTFDIKTAVGLD